MLLAPNLVNRQMLTEIKDRATGWIAWIIVILISIPFALWGVNEYFAGGDSLNVAVVNGQEIEQQAYRHALEERRSIARRMLGTQFDPDTVNSIEFRTAVLEDLILRQLLRENVQDAGFRVSDAQLAQFIKTTPQFQRDGEFDSAAYQQAVRSLGYTRTGFESYLRQQNILQQVRDGLEKSSFITAADEESMLKLASEKRVFDYITLATDQFLSDVQVSDQEVEEYYTANPELYQSPELVKIEYVRLAVADLAENVEVTEEDIQRFYEDNKELYGKPAQRNASHILLTVDEDAEDATVQEVREQAETLTDRARAGEDFADLAKEYSQDPGSAAQGGDLGLVEAGVMVKPFEDALFVMQEGEISDPVKTRYGYHVIKLTGLVPGQTKALAEVRDEIEKEERTKQAEALFVDRAETFRNMVFEQPESLAPVVDELDLELAVSDWFSQSSGEGIAEYSKIRDVAFSDDVYIENLNSEAIELDIDTLVAIRKKDSQAAGLKSLAEVQTEIEQALKLNKAKESVLQNGQELLANLNKGVDWETLLEESGLESKRATQSRLQPDPEHSLLLTAEVFRAPVPDEQPQYGSVTMPDGSYTVFRLDHIERGGPAMLNEDSREEVNASLSRRRGNDYFLSYQRGLRQSAEVEIFTENL